MGEEALIIVISGIAAVAMIVIVVIKNKDNETW